MALVAGVDCGTQSTKVVLRDADTGEITGLARRSHTPLLDRPGRSEQDPQDWADALRDCLSDLGDPQLAAISIGGQQHGLVVTDAAGTPLRPAKLWNDTESASDSERLIAALGPQEWADRVGSLPVAAFTITKLAWLARTHPDLPVERALLPHDWLTSQLTGAFTTDRGDASGTGYWSARTGWDAELLGLAGPFTAAMLPTVLEPLQAAGSWNGAVVAAGTGDNMAAALGLGAQVGDVILSLGTSGVASAPTASVTNDASGTVAGFADATGRFLPLVCTLNAMQVTDWISRLLGRPLDELATQAAPGSGGVLLQPHLIGERTPNRPDARGTVLGLSLTSSQAELARAAVEGVVASLLLAAEQLPTSRPERLLLTGGGAGSSAYRAVLSDLASSDITVLDAPEAVALGAAVQAAACLHQTPVEELAAAWAPEPVERLAAAGDPSGVLAAHRDWLARG